APVVRRERAGLPPPRRATQPLGVATLPPPSTAVPPPIPRAIAVPPRLPSVVVAPQTPSESIAAVPPPIPRAKTAPPPLPQPPPIPRAKTAPPPIPREATVPPATTMLVVAPAALPAWPVVVPEPTPAFDVDVELVSEPVALDSTFGSTSLFELQNKSRF